MATRAERQRKLEQYSDTDWEKLVWDGPWRKRPRDSRIEWLLNDAERDNHGDAFDHALGLLTDGEQQRQLQRDGVAAARSSSHAAWFSGGCALLALIVAVIALVVALVESG